MAIDNLYFRCVSSQVKLRNDVDDDDEEQKNSKQIPQFRISKKTDTTKKGKNEITPQEFDQDTYTSKSKKAIERLRTIKQYVESFKKIIDRCKAEKKKS